jgi:hypothetical protein
MATSINDSGAITGTYTDASTFNHGFVRSPQGTFTTFDVGEAMWNLSINNGGAVAGTYRDANGSSHGFVRSALGMITSFNVPGGLGITAVRINDLGVITGNYSTGGRTLGFLRVPPLGQGDDEFQPGIYALTDKRGLYVDGGFYLYGDPTVRLWVYVAGNPSQHWTFTKVSGGFTMLNQGTGQYASDIGGQLVEGHLSDVWTVTPA